MKVFDVIRWTDHTKVSGKGLVAQAVEFDSGRVAVAWIAKGRPKSVAVYTDLVDALFVHGHNGDTEFIEVWDSKDSVIDVRSSRRKSKTPARAK